MRIQIDTEDKTIRLEADTMLGEFVESIKKLLPDWESYKLTMGQITYWSHPIVIDRIPISPYSPPYWWTSPITVGTGPGSSDFGSTYCVDLQLNGSSNSTSNTAMSFNDGDTQKY
jgi:hypothetical protein